MPEVLLAVVETTTLRRVAKVREIASAAVFLASEEASYINGTVLQATGGQRAIASWR